MRYPGAVRDPDTGDWISDAEVAEIPYTAFASTNDPVTARLIVRRVRDARYRRRAVPGLAVPPVLHRLHRTRSPTPTSPTAATRSSKPCSPT